MAKCKHCDGLGGMEGSWTCDVCGGRGYASSDAGPERGIREHSLIVFWKWQHSHNKDNFGRCDAFMAGYALAAKAERERALEDALHALETVMEANCGLTDAEHVIRALKGKP